MPMIEDSAFSSELLGFEPLLPPRGQERRQPTHLPTFFPRTRSVDIFPRARYKLCSPIGGPIAKLAKATVCKTVIRRFESGSGLHPRYEPVIGSRGQLLITQPTCAKATSDASGA